MTGEDPTELLDLGGWSEQMDSATWRSRLARKAAKEEVRSIRRFTERGWPLAGDSALAKFEKVLGRRIRPVRRGRPARKLEGRK